MEPKHIVFLVLLLCGVPASIVVLRTSVMLQKMAVFFMIFMTPFVYSTGINFFTDKFYRGTSRGFEVLATDMIVLCVAGVLISKWGFKNFKWIAPGSVFYFFYFLLSCISIVNSESITYSGYEVMKMVNMYIFFIVLYNFLLKYKDLTIIIYAFAALIIFNLFYMLLQKYAWGIYQPSGIFPHRNGAAMFANMIAPLFLSLMFNANLSRRLFWFFSFVFAVSAVVVVVSLSRGAILFFPLAALLVAAVSFSNGTSQKKIRIFMALAVVAVLGALKSAPMVIERFEYAPKSSAEGRVQLAKAALNMAGDKFWGVGLNNWGIKINPPYTYSEGTGMERPSEDYKSGIVETIYLLVAAECGWIGFVALLGWMGFYYYKNFKNVKIYSRTNLFYMPVGLLGGLSAAYGQSTLEWVLKQPANFYHLMTVYAIIAAMLELRRQNVLNRKALK